MLAPTPKPKFGASSVAGPTCVGPCSATGHHADVTIHFTDQGTPGQTRTDGRCDLGCGDRLVQSALGTAGQSNLGHFQLLGVKESATGPPFLPGNHELVAAVSGADQSYKFEFESPFSLPKFEKALAGATRLEPTTATV